MKDMFTIDMNFEMPKNESSIIKVIGVGGGGGNAVAYMNDKGIEGVDFIVCNTDMQALENNPILHKIQLGEDGLGAGADPEVGRQSTEQSIKNIEKSIGHKTKMVFITAGMGGGTGTGGAPVIANVCRQMDILTVGVVTLPFVYEGPKKQQFAKKGVEELRKYVDAIIVINNEKLDDVYGGLAYDEGYAKSDEILSVAVKSMAELISKNLKINIDLKDARTVLKNKGMALFGSSIASGENRAEDAIQKALDSPLLESNTINGASDVLLQILSSKKNKLTVNEITKIHKYIQHEAKNEANIIPGLCEDETLQNDEIRVTVVATGFKEKEISKFCIPLDEDQPIIREMQQVITTAIPKKKKIKPPQSQAYTLFDLENDQVKQIDKIIPNVDETIHQLRALNQKVTDISKIDISEVEKEPAYKRAGLDLNEEIQRGDDVKKFNLDDDNL